MEDRAVLDAIKHAIDLRQVIEVEKGKPTAEYIQGLCPFHPEKTGSFTVYRDHYYCFACHVHGDIFTWLGTQTGGDFRQAVERAAQMCGIPLSDDHQKRLEEASKQRARMIEEVSTAQGGLWASEEALNYLRDDRRLSDETILQFGLGWDQSVGAIVIPIFDRAGNTISYMRRNLRSKPKYWSQNSYWYRKGASLYNCQAIGSSDTVHLVEGPFDCMTLAEIGVECPLATGTGVATEQQIDMLGQHCETVVLIPDCKKDNDWKLLKQNVERFRIYAPQLTLRVAFPPGADVNDCDHDRLREALDETYPAELAILDLVLRTGEQADQYPRAREFVQSIPDLLVRDDVVRALATRWGKDHGLVAQALMGGDPTQKMPVTVPMALDALREEAQLLREMGMKLNWMGLDPYVKRTRAGHVIFILGRTGIGKTMVLLNLLRRTKGDFTQLVLSLEQSKMEIANRLALMTSWEIGPGMTEQDLEHTLLECPEAYEALRTAMRNVYPHVRIEDATLSTDEIRSVMRNVAMDADYPLRVVWLDYLGLVNEPGEAYARVSAVANDMKRIAKEYQVLMVALVQLSRKGGSGRRPVTIDMARDSGVIEEAADLMIGVHRPLEEAEEAHMSEVPMIADIIKNRHGRTGHLEWTFDKTSLDIGPRPFNMVADDAT